MNVMRDVPIGGGVVHFDVRGKEFSLKLDALDRFPDSYVTWIVQNNLEYVRSGKPIPINRRPDMFQNLLKNISAGPPTSRNGSTSSSQRHPTGSDVPQSLHDRMPNGGYVASPMPTRDTLYSPGHSNSHRQPQTPRPKNPYEAFNINRYRQSQQPSMSSTGTHHPVDSEDLEPRDYEDKSYGGRSRMMVPPKRTDQVVGEALQDILKILRRCTKHRQMFDKALILLTWGHTGEGRVLRPQLSKLYDSMTGRVHDVRRSSESSTSYEPMETSGWGELDSVYLATCISTRVQNLVVDGLRNAGFASSFAEVKLNKHGIVDWRGNRGSGHHGNVLESTAVRCLVVHLR